MFRHLLCFPPGRTPIVIIIMNIILAFIYCHNHPCDNLIIIILVLILITVLVVNNTSVLKVAKIRDEPQKMTPTTETEMLLGMGPQ